MAKFCNLFSSSSGNSTYISCSSGSILVDAGRSAAMLTRALEAIDADPVALSGVFVTHEHSDHVAGIRVFCSKYHVPVYATRGTLDALCASGAIDERVNAVEINADGTEAGGMFITPFSTSHDCADSCGYIIETPDAHRIAVCTDLGYVSPSVSGAITGSDFVMIESNHDVGMLKSGRYPHCLKQRILGINGHLSNDTCAGILPSLVESGTVRIMLAHLSRENNTPSLAYQTAIASLTSHGMVSGRDYLLAVAPPDGAGVSAF